MARSDERAAWCPVCGGDGIEHTPIGTKPCRKGPHTVTRRDERAAVCAALCGIMREFNDRPDRTVTWVFEQLAAQGLHVVLDADDAVLKVMANKRIEQLRGTVNCRSEHADVCEAELARREGER